MSGVTLLNPGGCEDDCYECEECEEAPSRVFCQYRSGANGQNVATRPTVSITVEITGSGSPECGGCAFTEHYTYTCGTPIFDAVESCSFTGTWPGTGAPDDCVRTINFSVQSIAGGFRVQVEERFTYPTPPGPGLNSYQVRYITRDFIYDNFGYTDCDGDPVTDNNGALSFTAGDHVVNEGLFDPGEDKCNIAATITAVNN